MKITIIGAGNMGCAIALGLANGSIIKAQDITCTDVSSNVLEKINAINPLIQTTTNNHEAIKKADMIVLAVKPWLIEKVVSGLVSDLNYKKQIIVSIAAGITFEQLSGFLKNKNQPQPTLFRLIPNTAISVRSSMTFVAAQNATQEQINLILNLFDELGLTMLIEERLVTAGTALGSCGIAYAFRYIRAAMEGGIELGLYPSQAKEVILQTLKGAIDLLKANGTHPEEEIDKVTTPGGITIKGLNEMEHAGFTSSIIKGLKASK